MLDIVDFFNLLAASQTTQDGGQEESIMVEVKKNNIVQDLTM